MFEIRSSSISGKGIFASRDFKKGEVDLTWDTTCTLTNKEVAELSEEEKHFVSKYKGGYILYQPPERYVNHSCDPNTHVENDCDVAIRDIQAGEEITTDYLKEGAGIQFDLCKCGSSNCIKRVR